MPSKNLEKIYTSPYRSFIFQQLVFYDIFCSTRILRIIGRRLVVVYTTVNRFFIDFLALIKKNKINENLLNKYKIS